MWKGTVIMDIETLKILQDEQARLKEESLQVLKLHQKYPRKLKPRIKYEELTAQLMEVWRIALLHGINLDTGEQIIKNN